MFAQECGWWFGLEVGNEHSIHFKLMFLTVKTVISECEKNVQD